MPRGEQVVRRPDESTVKRAAFVSIIFTTRLPRPRYRRQRRFPLAAPLRLAEVPGRVIEARQARRADVVRLGGNCAAAVRGQHRAWHYMVFCSRCGARPALPLPKGEALCRLHGGRLPQPAERWSTGASGGSRNIMLPNSRQLSHRRPGQGRG